MVWLSTTGSDGAPYLVPTWFVWDGRSIVIRSKPHARKVRNLQHEPRTMLALGDAEDDFDVGLLRARAEVDIPRDASVLPAMFLAKYAARIAVLGLTPTEFAATYSATIRLIPERALGWHGRSIPGSLMAAARRLIEDRPTITLGRPTATLGAAWPAR